MLDLEFLSDSQEAIKYLSSSLNDGNLVLFLGAGVSIGLGLPNWATLVNLIREKKGLKLVPTASSAEELQKAAEEIRIVINEDTEYFRVLKECLYCNTPNLSSSILSNKLLISLGTLFTSNRRGSVKRVVTLNFDSMLEWYLQLCGFDVRVVYKFPHLEGSEDIIIYHPHGFLPHKSMNLENSDFIIFDLKQANNRLNPHTNDSQYQEKTRNYLRTGVCLFIGMSEATFDDRTVGSLVTQVGEEVKHGPNGRPTGFWFVQKDTFANIKDYFIDNNIVPLSYGSVDDIPDFLLGIAHHSSKLILT